MFGKIKWVLSEEIEAAIGDKMCCKILFFQGNYTPTNISVMLECVAKDSMEEVIKRRRSLGYELVQKCPSPDFFFPVNQRIRVYVAGRFALDKHIGKSYYCFTFFPFAVDNYIYFPVHRYTGMECAAFGIMSFREDNGTKKDLHVIHYDPWSTRGKPQGNPRKSSIQSAPPKRPIYDATYHQKARFNTTFDNCMYNNFVSKELAINITPFNIKNIEQSN
jgi:hypothetical protein